MRKTLLSGLALVAVAFLTVVVGSWLDLEIGDTALLGVAAGAVVVMVPHGTTARRVGAFTFGVVLTIVGYFVRAALLPDTEGGRAVFAAVVVALCVLVAVVSRQRLAMWALLLGVVTFSGAFEAIYNAEPPQVAPHALTTLTALVVCVAAGFFAASFFAPPRDQQAAPAGPVEPAAAPTPEPVMEDSK